MYLKIGLEIYYIEKNLRITYDMIELFIGFQIKHFICDFILQRPFQYLNKGKYLHLGGVLHAGIHGLGTLILVGLDLYWFALLDLFLHYHIDYFKIQINKKYNLKPYNSEYYWWLLGLDQLLHQLTYGVVLWQVL